MRRKSRLRIALVAPPFYEVPPRRYGGTELVCALLADGLVEAGHDVTVVGAGPRRVRAAFVATFATSQPEHLPTREHVEAAHAARVARILHELAPDVVHEHTRLGRYAASHGPPTVATVHSALAGPDRETALIDSARTVPLVALSDSQRGDAPELAWMATVHNGIDTARYPFRVDKEAYVLYLGRISRHKGVHAAIAAARHAGRDLIIAGSWTIEEERAYFDTVIAPLLDEDVRWIGPVTFDEKVELLAGARCLLLPARWHEPFGLVALEAMACGTPVVARRAGAMVEIVADGSTGRLCDADEGLADAMAAIHTIDPYACRARVAERFDASAMVAAYEGVYAELLDSW